MPVYHHILHLLSRVLLTRTRAGYLCTRARIEQCGSPSVSRFVH